MKKYLEEIICGRHLSRESAADLMQLIVRGEATEVEIAGFLTALATKGETADEVVGMVQTMRQHMIPVSLNMSALDTCGTGGDGASTINVSTLSAFVCAAAGVPVVKHGNRAVSSRCGSFDVLEAVGVKIDLSAEQVESCLSQCGIGFCFAPLFHPAMKYVAPIRRALKVRTVFNILGPLLNPAAVSYQVIGCSIPKMIPVIGEALMRLGSTHVLLVSASDGLDEVSPAAPTTIYDYEQGKPIRTHTMIPEQIYPIHAVSGGDAAQNAIRFRAILEGRGSEAEKAFVTDNAALGLYAVGTVGTIDEGRGRAREVLASGAAFTLLQKVIACTQSL